MYTLTATVSSSYWPLVSVTLRTMLSVVTASTSGATNSSVGRLDATGFQAYVSGSPRSASVQSGGEFWAHEAHGLAVPVPVPASLTVVFSTTSLSGPASARGLPYTRTSSTDTPL